MFLKKIFGLGTMIQPDPENSHISIPSNLIKPLQHGDQVPDFKFVDSEGDNYSFYSMLDESPVVLVFFRGLWCPYCVLELQQIEEEINEFGIRNVKIVAIGSDSLERTKEFKERHDLGYILVSDHDNVISKSFQLSIPVKGTLNSVEMQYLSRVHQLDVENAEVAIPATYIVDKAARILYNFIDYDFTKRLEVKELPNLVTHVTNKNPQRIKSVS